jgi:hypothetical protein
VVAADEVVVLRAADGAELGRVRPFDGAVSAAVAVGDVDGDAVPDLAVAGPSVTVWSGASGYRDVVRRVDEAAGSVALGDLNGDHRDDVVIGAAGRPHVVVVDGATGDHLADLDTGDPGARGAAVVATGMVEEGGRVSLLAAVGSVVRMYDADLLGDAEGVMPEVHHDLRLAEVARLDVGGAGGVSLATGYPLAPRGGFADVVVGHRDQPGRVDLLAVATAHDEHEVAASGVVRPHVYDATAPRRLEVRRTIDLSGHPDLASGVQAATVSTTSAARLAVVPTTGGALRWVDVPVEDAPATVAGAATPFNVTAVAGM